MSGLARFLEEAGISTVTLALLRLHAEKMRPPRVLWVPFELGRPIGSPGDATFQRRVLEAALSLFDASAGPVLEDFPQDDPRRGGETGWVCPVPTDRRALASEFELVRVHYERALAGTHRTTVGVSGLDIGTAVAHVARFLTPEQLENPRRDLHHVQLLRFAIDDVKAAYLEAAAAGGGIPSSAQLTGWFWRETAAARTILDIREHLREHDDDTWRMGMRWLVPETWLEDFGLPSSFG